MITLISYILIMLGAGNWLFIGLMQYDFVAGFFGTQSSFLSRLVYITVGFGAIWFLAMTIKGRGTVKINNNGFIRSKKNQQTSREQNHMQTQNVELGNEIHERNSHTHQNPFD